MASSSTARPLSPVLVTVSAAAKRHALALVVEQLPWALSAFLAGVTLLLFFGTHYLSPFWLLLFAGIGLGIAATRIYARRTSRYRIAQMLDRRLQLHDSLSTAWYILGNRQQGWKGNFAAQIESAESLAASVKPQAAFPVQFRRTWLAPAVLFALCCTLAALRWTHTDQIDLRRPLLPTQLQSLLEHPPSEAAETAKEPALRQPSSDVNLPMPDVAGAPPTEKPSSSPQSPQNADMRNGPNTLANAAPDARTPSSPSSPADPSAATKQEKTQSSSALDRMKDALGGVMSKLEQAVKPKDSSGQKNAKDGQKSSGDDDAQASQDPAKDRADKASSKSDKQGESSKGESNSEAQAVEKNQPGQLGDATSSNDQHGNNAQSGAGHNDGRKDMQDAAQLKALGKLAEIIGKRSASLTGEMTVEKPSGAQQLKTQYSNQNAEHSDSGGEINHDQIPLEYRDFIRTYMQEVHQNPPASKPSAPTAH